MVRVRAAIVTALALLGTGCSAQSTAARPAVTPVGLVTHVLPGCTTAAQEGPVVSAAATSMAAVFDSSQLESVNVADLPLGVPDRHFPS
jgi:hypothetical protein